MYDNDINVNKGSENKYSLPPGWRWVKSGEECEFRHGGTPTKSNPSFWNGTIPWISPKDMKVRRLTDSKDHITREAINKSAAGTAPANSILVVIRSGILARHLPVAIVGCDLAFNQDIKAVVPNIEILDPHFLLFLLENKEAHILSDGIKKGATVHSFKSGYIENLQFPLPPLADQKRIAAILNEQMAAAEELRASLEAKLNEINSLPQALYRRAFSGEI